MTYTYNNKGTCSVRTVVELNDDHTIKSVQVPWRLRRQPEGHRQAAARHEGRGRHRPHGRHDPRPQASTSCPRPDRPGIEGRTGGDAVKAFPRG